MAAKTVNMTEAFEGQLGVILKRARLAKGWTQAEAAAEFGFSDSEVSLYEWGKRIPGFTRIVIMCDRLDIDINDLAELVRNAV